MRFMLAGFFLATALLLAPPTNGLMAGEAEETLQDLYSKKRLFEKSEYKKVRSAVAKMFEARNAEIIKQAFEDDHERLMQWLQSNPDIRDELFTAIDEQHDSVEAALKLFKDIWKAHPDKIKTYANLAIAVAVVWDKPREDLYDYRGHQVRCKSTLPSPGIGPLEIFAYFIEQEPVMQGRCQLLPWEFLVYLVNHRTPINERKWACQEYLSKRGMFGKCYKDVPYDYGMLRGGTPRLADQAYTLENIRRYGGVCAMQADFAARVGSSMGVPAAYVGGEANSGGLHAWVMWVELKSVTKEKILFSLESYGRYNIDHYYTGELKDPQTGQRILDRDMELRLSVVGWDRNGKHHADLAIRAMPMIVEKHNLDGAAKLNYYNGCLALCPWHEESWLGIARLCRDKELPSKHLAAINTRKEKLFKDFAKFPDFTWKVFDDLMSIQTELPAKIKLYEKLVASYELAGRPDLACQARLKLVDYQVENKQFKPAATGLANTILKFPDEGRYMPQLMDRLEEVCQNFKGGTDQLRGFYLTVLPRIPTKRGDEPSKYCIGMYQKAIAFFRDQGQEKVAQGLQAELARFAPTAAR